MLAVVYESEASFNKAFKRVCGTAKSDVTDDVSSQSPAANDWEWSCLLAGCFL